MRADDHQDTRSDPAVRHLAGRGATDSHVMTLLVSALVNGVTFKVRT